MGTATLTIDLDALVANWTALDAASGRDVMTGAVVKANGYGLDAGRVASALAAAGARQFFVAAAEEGVAVRNAIGPGPAINVFSGHMPGDLAMIEQARLTPMLNSTEQLTRHFETLPGHPFGIQLDTGMNRLGMEADEWFAVAEIALSQRPRLVMSHLACADEPHHAENAAQLKEFHRLTDGISAPRSLAATGGILLGKAYHFNLTRPGIGLYGGLPFDAARPVVRLSIPVVQARTVLPEETVGYGCSWAADRESVIATVAAGYADGLIRAMSNRAVLWHGPEPCPLVGRVSMDLLTVDITGLPEIPEYLDILCPAQGVDTLAEAAGTIGYEVLTSLGGRYKRAYTGGPA
ncbi:alanine racemase [Tropicimonas sp. S265A]|uniref:alanine racemase n=1 Tax=Tropicimonas sp. S265A TaxID=3415134 RepID=UPI003C7DA3DB